MINLTRTPYCSNFYVGHLMRPGFQDLYRCLPQQTASIIINKLLDFMYSDKFTIKKSTDIELNSSNITSLEEYHFKAALDLIDESLMDFSLKESLDKGTTKAFGTKFNGIMVRFFWHDSNYMIGAPSVFCFNSESHTCIDIFFDNILANPENYIGATALIMITLDAILQVLICKTTNQEYSIADTGLCTIINVPKDSAGLAFFIDYYTKLFNLFNNIIIGENNLLKDTIKDTVSADEIDILFSKLFLLDSCTVGYIPDESFYGHTIVTLFNVLYDESENPSCIADIVYEFFGNIYDDIMYTD